MRIRYVVSSMIFWGREHPLSLETECEFLKSLGFGIELWPNIKGQHDCRYERRNWQRLAAATEDMLVAMRSRHDSPTLEQWNEQIECAELLGAHIITDLQNMGIPEEPELNGCDFAAQIVKYAQEKNVTLCIETGRLAMLKEVGQRFESVRFCLDTSYASLGGPDGSGFRQYVDDLSPRIAHLHLSDNYRPDHNGQVSQTRLSCKHPSTRLRMVSQSNHFGFPGGSSAYQGLCRFWCGGGMPFEDWEYLLESLNKYDNDVIGSIEMSPCMPAVMIRQASEFLFDTLNWPNRPEKPDGNDVERSGHADVGYHPK